MISICDSRRRLGIFDFCSIKPAEAAACSPSFIGRLFPPIIYISLQHCVIRYCGHQRQGTLNITHSRYELSVSGMPTLPNRMLIFASQLYLWSILVYQNIIINLKRIFISFIYGGRCQSNPVEPVNANLTKKLKNYFSLDFHSNCCVALVQYHTAKSHYEYGSPCSSA